VGDIPELERLVDVDDLDALLAALELCSLVQTTARAILSRMKADSIDVSKW
jgi:hypothetical protein